ncbi:MAG: prepilin-type N-terminal cleavage/methylation domain-containing protein [Clostridia bacterium]|nr:prepilin-type N-terminal cleavage/methylation domain-containing protein [Clostridia bacterium]
MSGRKLLQTKRAFTLAELVVVMAVMAIMISMVVSFTLICNAWSKWGTNRYKLTSTERLCSTFFRKFVSLYDAEDYYFETTEDNGVLTAVSVSDPTERYAFYYHVNGEELEFNVKGGEDGYCPVQYVRSVHFSVRTNAKNQQLIMMRVSYAMPNTSVGLNEQYGNYDILMCTRGTGAKP